MEVLERLRFFDLKFFLIVKVLGKKTKLQVKNLSSFQPEAQSSKRYHYTVL